MGWSEATVLPNYSEALLLVNPTGLIFADDFESGDVTAWSQVVSPL